MADLTFLAETSLPCETLKSIMKILRIFDNTVRNKQMGVHLFSVFQTLFLLLLWSLTKHIRILKKRLRQIVLKIEDCRDEPHMVLTFESLFVRFFAL